MRISEAFFNFLPYAGTFLAGVVGGFYPQFLTHHYASRADRAKYAGFIVLEMNRITSAMRYENGNTPADIKRLHETRKLDIIEASANIAHLIHGGLRCKFTAACQSYQDFRVVRFENAQKEAMADHRDPAPDEGLDDMVQIETAREVYRMLESLRACSANPNLGRELLDMASSFWK